MKRTRTGMPAGLGAAVRRVHDAARGRTVAVAESCTGGLLGAWLTSRGGSSAWFLGGVIAYANGVKMRLLGVGAEALRRHGAVSAPVARAMAEGVRRTLGADVGVSITGVAGPAGGTARKPVGLVYIGVATAAGARTRRRVLSGNRMKVRSLAARAALDELAGALEAKS